MQKGHKCGRGMNAEGARMRKGHKCGRGMNAEGARMRKRYECGRGMNVDSPCTVSVGSDSPCRCTF